MSRAQRLSFQSRLGMGVDVDKTGSHNIVGAMDDFFGRVSFEVTDGNNAVPCDPDIEPLGFAPGPVDDGKTTGVVSGSASRGSPRPSAFASIDMTCSRAGVTSRFSFAASSGWCWSKRFFVPGMALMVFSIRMANLRGNRSGLRGRHRGELIPIEVKLSATPRPAMASGIRGPPGCGGRVGSYGWSPPWKSG